MEEFFIPLVGRENLGYVADFCSFCNQIRAHQIRRVAPRRYLLLLIPMSWGETRGYERRCQKCRVVTTAQPALYRPFERSPECDLDDLIARTYPNCRTVWADALADSRALEHGRSLPSARRQAIILQRLALLNDSVRTRCAAAHLDEISGATIVIAIVTALVLLIQSQSPSIPVAYGFSLPAWASLAPAALPGICILTDVPRFLRRWVYPHLARGLAALDPPVDELREALKAADLRGWCIGRKLNPVTLRRYIDGARRAAELDRNMR